MHFYYSKLFPVPRVLVVVVVVVVVRAVTCAMKRASSKCKQEATRCLFAFGASYQGQIKERGMGAKEISHSNRITAHDRLRVKLVGIVCAVWFYIK